MTFELRNQNFIGGAWCDSASGRRYAVRNPADWRNVCHEYPLSTPADLERACARAAKAFETWRKEPPAVRARIMLRVAALIRERREQIARVITLENGKLLRESLAEIDAAASELEYQISEGLQRLGKLGDGLRSNLLAFTRGEPLGVVAAIVPWNFPFNVPFRKLGPALLAGNTAILKPATQTPGVGETVVQLFIEAGLPPDVLQFVTGSGRDFGDAISTHPLIKAVSFTGSTSVGRRIAQQAAASFKRTQLEMGGKNPILILRDADLKAAVAAAVTGAFSCAGQWCTSTSRVIVENAVADEVVAGLREAARNLKLGPGDAPESSMGPVSGMEQLSSILGHLQKAHEQGARVLCGGGRETSGALMHGCFIQPTLLDGVTEKMDVAREEIFGPVLSIMRVESFEEGLGLCNRVPYGLASSVFTRDLAKALRFVDETEAGLTHVNLHTAYKEPQHPFGGWKASGFGLPEAGDTGILFFQDLKAVYVAQ